jgi:hypothetical protein
MALTYTVLRIITRSPRLTLHEQVGMPVIRSHIEKLTTALYQKSAGSENSQIQELGQ